MPGMSGGFGGPKRQRRAAADEAQLKCTLEELARGVQKKLKVTEPSGSSKVFTVDVKPGWKAGTKVTFNRPEGGTIAFIIAEKPHRWFKRRGNDLLYTCKLTQRQAERGVKLTIPMLDGEQFVVKTSDLGQISRGGTKRISGKGMPIKGGPAKGDLIINFTVGRL